MRDLQSSWVVSHTAAWRITNHHLMIAYSLLYSSGEAVIAVGTSLEADWLFTGMPWGAIQKEGAFSSEIMYLLIRMFKNYS